MPSITLSSQLTVCANSNLYNCNCCQCSGCTYPGLGYFYGTVFPCSNMRYATTSTVACSGTRNYGGINVMKGSVPINFSELTSGVSRDADLLVKFFSSSQLFSTSNQLGNPISLTTLPAVSTGSGVATWFWIPQTVNLNTGNCTCWSTTQYNRLWGTVGLQGSGADLEISDTNIVVNNVYKIINLRLSIPQTYNY